MSTNTVTLILIAILSCVWLGDFINGLFQRKNVKSQSSLTDANATQVLIAGASTLVTPLTNRLREAEDEATALRRELQTLRTELQAMTEELNDTRMELRQERAENRRVTTENRKLRHLTEGTA